MDEGIKLSSGCCYKVSKSRHSLIKFQCRPSYTDKVGFERLIEN